MSASRSNDDDLELWEAYLKGNQKAIGKLYNKHFPKLVLYCYGLTRDMDKAQDLVQDVFKKLIEEPCEAIVFFEGWIRNTARLQFMSANQTEQRRRAKLSEFYEGNQSWSEIHNEMDAEQLRKTIHESLSPEDAKIISMTADGYPNQEIAQTFGMEDEPFRKKKNYLRKKLAKTLGLKK